MKVAVPVTLPEGCVGRAEVSVRENFQGEEEDCSVLKIREGKSCF